MKIGFFDEGEGQKSVTRLIFFIGSIWCMFICTYVVFTIKTISLGELAILFTSIMGTLGGIKVGQKMLESKSPVVSTPTEIKQ